MSFKKVYPVTRNPDIGQMEIRLFRTVDESHPDFPQVAFFDIMVVDQFGAPMDHESGDLIPHLTTQQKNQILAFMDDMWAKAEEKLLPSPK